MQDFIKSAFAYIEKNLRTDITIDELAQAANYSTGHYSRLFARATGSSVTNYILKRRLDRALVEISLGKKAIGVVLEYGFNTYAGFYKAFVKMYGCSPKKYLSIYKKTEVFIMRSEKDIQAILGNWDIPKGLEIEDVSTKDWKTAKIVCETWKVGGKYYLKTSERSKMIRNIKIAKALKNEGLLSEFLPISTVAGDDYLDGEHIFLLTAKIGEPLDNRPLSNDEVATVDNNLSREKYAYKLGQSIAKLHRALKSVQDDIKPDEINLYKQVVKAIPKVKEYSIKYSMKTDEDFFDDYIKNFGELHETLPRQLIHGNLVGESAVYENDEVVCFKGFEIYNISNIRLFDAVYCAGETNTQPLESYLEILKNILKGYDSVNSLTMQEKQSVYYVLCSIGMNMLAYCDETLDVSKRNREALVLLSKNKEKFFNLI